MKVIILNKPGHFVQTRKDYISNEIASDEAVVRVHRVGICGTDLRAFAGVQPFFSYPRVLGHELGVEIIQIGENARGLKVGDLCIRPPEIQRSSPCGSGRTRRRLDSSTESHRRHQNAFQLQFDL